MFSRDQMWAGYKGERQREGEQGTERKGQEAEQEGEFDSGIILEEVWKSQ